MDVTPSLLLESLFSHPSYLDQLNICIFLGPLKIRSIHNIGMYYTSSYIHMFEFPALWVQDMNYDVFPSAQI